MYKNVKTTNLAGNTISITHEVSPKKEHTSEFSKAWINVNIDILRSSYDEEQDETIYYKSHNCFLATNFQYLDDLDDLIKALVDTREEIKKELKTIPDWKPPKKKPAKKK